MRGARSSLVLRRALLFRFGRVLAYPTLPCRINTHSQSFSNLFVEFLLKEASHGQSTTRRPANTSSPGSGSIASPASSSSALPPLRSPSFYSTFSPTESGATTPFSTFGRPRQYSSGSMSSQATAGGDKDHAGAGAAAGPGILPGSIGRKPSYSLQEAMGGKG